MLKLKEEIETEKREIGDEIASVIESSDHMSCGTLLIMQVRYKQLPRLASLAHDSKLLIMMDYEYQRHREWVLSTILLLNRGKLNSMGLTFRR